MQGPMLQQKNQPNDLFCGHWEEGFLLGAQSSRCRGFLSTMLKTMVGRKETTGANGDCSHRQRLVQDPRLSEEVKLQSGLGCMKFICWTLQLLGRAFHCVWQLFMQLPI